MRDQGRGLEVLQIRLWAEASPEITATVMGLGLAGVMCPDRTVTWNSSRSRIVLAGCDRSALLRSMGALSAQLQRLARELGTRTPLASHLAMYATHTRNITEQLECQETVAWRVRSQGRQGSTGRTRPDTLLPPPQDPAPP